MWKNIIFFNFLFFTIFLNSCKKNNYLPKNFNETVHYEVIFRDKEQNRKQFRQSYHVFKGPDNKVILLKNDGQLISYSIGSEAIEIQTTHYTLEQDSEKFPVKKRTYLPLPVKIGHEWKEDDKTTLKLKLGYDRVYNSNLPLEITNKIIGRDSVKLKNGKKISCLKITGNGTTSFAPGPPLGNINIEVNTQLWLSEGYGLVRYIREEKADSVTMGDIFYEKTLLIE